MSGANFLLGIRMPWLVDFFYYVSRMITWTNVIEYDYSERMSTITSSLLYI